MNWYMRFKKDMTEYLPELAGKKLYGIPFYPRYAVTKDGWVIDMREYNRIFNGIGAPPIIYNDNGVAHQMTARDFTNAYFGQFPACDIRHHEEDCYDANNLWYAPDDIKFSKDGTSIYINDKEFRQIPGFSIYYINEYGLVYSMAVQKFAKLHSTNAYATVALFAPEKRATDNKKTIDKYVHHLVYECWVGEVPKDSSLVVDHIDEDRTNNYYKNLQIITKAENNAKTRARLDAQVVSKIADRARTWSPDILDTLCRWMAEENLSTSKICDNLGLTDESDRRSMVSLLFSLRNGGHKEISSKYDFSNYDSMKLRDQENSKGNLDTFKLHEVIKILQELGHSPVDIAKVLKYDKKFIIDTIERFKD